MLKKILAIIIFGSLASCYQIACENTKYNQKETINYLLTKTNSLLPSSINPTNNHESGSKLPLMQDLPWEYMGTEQIFLHGSKNILLLYGQRYQACYDIELLDKVEQYYSIENMENIGWYYMPWNEIPTFMNVPLREMNATYYLVYMNGTTCDKTHLFPAITIWICKNG